MKHLLIKNAKIVNEGRIKDADILVTDQRIEKIDEFISPPSECEILDAGGKYLLPGMIDDQVHFREPGVTHKGDIHSESRAAVAGGITSYMEMPNVKPPTLTLEALEAKFERAHEKSIANYSFYMGASNDNLEEIKRLNKNQACGVKVFMGASTGNMLVDNIHALEGIFQEAPSIVVTHCEDSPIILANEAHYREKFGEQIPVLHHPDIRSREACLKSSTLAVELAKKFGTQLHVLHLTSADELSLFTPGPISGKNITLEACVHHLFFSSDDYPRLGNQIKCNPAIKTLADREALLRAVNEDIIDIIATDHAPHTWEEKQADSYFDAPAGLPLVQHALPSLLEHYHNEIFTLERIVQKVCHNVAERFKIQDRGYIREGYFADLVLIDLYKPFTVNKSNILYKCGWSPFEHYTFRSSIDTTIVNGNIVYRYGHIQEPGMSGQRIQFNR